MVHELVSVIGERERERERERKQNKRERARERPGLVEIKNNTLS